MSVFCYRERDIQDAASRELRTLTAVSATIRFTLTTGCPRTTRNRVFPHPQPYKTLHFSRNKSLWIPSFSSFSPRLQVLTRFRGKFPSDLRRVPVFDVGCKAVRQRALQPVTPQQDAVSEPGPLPVFDGCAPVEGSQAQSGRKPVPDARKRSKLPDRLYTEHGDFETVFQGAVFSGG